MAVTFGSRLRTTLFDLDPREASFELRGFAATTPDKREALEAAGSAFVDGYRAAIRIADPAATAAACEDRPAPLRGFAYEGAAMGLSLLDLCSAGVPRRFRAFLDRHAFSHPYMVHVGAGWAIARWPTGALTFLPKLDPLLRWLTVDGIGFHSAFFHPSRIVESQRLPLLRRCGPDAFDAGVGRALWFVDGGQPSLVVRHIASFPAARRPALWGGLGLAVAYAGGTSDEDLRALAGAAGDHRALLAVGAAYAAKTRERAGNPIAHTERACLAFGGVTALEAARATDECLAQSMSADDPFRRCRQLLADRFSPASRPVEAS